MIAKDLSINVSSCYNVLKTLVDGEFLEFDKKYKTYRIGLGAIELARRALGAGNVYPFIRGQMGDLADRYEVTVGLWRLIRQSRFLLAGVEYSEQVMRIQISIGQRLPLWTGAVGRTAAATRSFSLEEAEKGIDEVRWQSRPTLQEYVRQVEAVRKSGWAIDTNQWRQGVTTIASAIVDVEGEFQFAVSASMFTGQHDHVIVQKIGEELRDIARYASLRAFGENQTLHPSKNSARGDVS